METIERKRFGSITDEIAAQRAELFIEQQTHGAGTWPDQAKISIAQFVHGGRLCITDKIGTDRGGPLRHIELRRGSRVIVTFVYNHFNHRLVRTF